MLLTISDGADSVIQFITVLLIFVMVLVITMLVTRWIGKFQKMQNIGENVQVLESVRISPSACVEILKIGNKYIAVALSKDSVTMLCELDEAEISKENGNLANNDAFAGIFDRVKKGFLAGKSEALEGSREDEQ